MTHPQMTLEETISAEMCQQLVVVSISELMKVVTIPLYADYLATEKEIVELEKAESQLSVIITRLRTRQPVIRNEAVILDLTERLRK